MEMIMLLLCADINCKKRFTCFRFAADPLKELTQSNNIRVESTLHHPDEISCSKYYAITLYPTKEAYETYPLDQAA